jgi:hypothetical protein
MYKEFNVIVVVNATQLRIRMNLNALSVVFGQATEEKDLLILLFVS